MRSSSILLPLAGTIALATAAPLQAETSSGRSSVLVDRSPVPEIGAILNDLPALVGDIVSTSISIVTALKDAVQDDALVRNDLDRVLGQPPPPPPPPPPPGSTTTPGTAPGGAQVGNGIAARQDPGQGGTQNGSTPVNGSAACPDVAVLFARGTREPGNVGFLTGPPFFAALETYVNGTSAIAVQGISYRSRGSSSSPDKGPALMADFARRTAAACPNTRISMAGYSAGAVVVRSALEEMGAAGGGGAGAVNSVVLFGDPREGQPVPAVDVGRVVTFCHDGDIVCRRSLDRQNATAPGGPAPPAGGQLVGDQDDLTGTDGRRNMLGAHLDYGLDAPAAAMFVMQRSGLGVASADAMNLGMDGTLAGMVQDIARNGVNGIAG